MTDRYGPQTAQIEALLERIRNLTQKEAEALWDAWDDARDAWAAGHAAARRGAVRGAAWDATRVAARDAAWYAWDAREAAQDAIVALVVRDLIGQQGFTQEHYDTLVGPWESVMGAEWTREEA